MSTHRRPPGPYDVFEAERPRAPRPQPRPRSTPTPPPAAPTPTLPGTPVVIRPPFTADSPVATRVIPANLGCGWVRPPSGPLVDVAECSNPLNAAGTALATSRATSDITQVVIHSMLGTFDGTVAGWDKGTSGQACCKSHYAVKADGTVAQVALEKFVVSHAKGNNAFAVGIEHDGFADNPAPFTEALYQASARLTRDICMRNGIPINRTHVVGHYEARSGDHVDPGGYWDWDYYMALVQWDGVTASSRPARVVVDATMTASVTPSGKGWARVAVPRPTRRDKHGDFQRHVPDPSHAWGAGILRAARQPTFANGVVFKMTAPVAGTYELAGWWPKNADQNPETAITVFAGPSGGVATPRFGVFVDQTSTNERLERPLFEKTTGAVPCRPPVPGRPECVVPVVVPRQPVWVPLGTLTLNAGDQVWPTVWQGSRRPGAIVADAFRMLKRC